MSNDIEILHGIVKCRWINQKKMYKIQQNPQMSSTVKRKIELIPLLSGSTFQYLWQWQDWFRSLNPANCTCYV